MESYESDEDNSDEEILQKIQTNKNSDEEDSSEKDFIEEDSDEQDSSEKKVNITKSLNFWKAKNIDFGNFLGFTLDLSQDCPCLATNDKTICVCCFDYNITLIF